MEKPPVKNARECIPPSKVIISSGPKICSLQKKEGYLAQKQPNMPPNQHLWSVQTRKLASPAYLLLYLTKKRRNKNYPTQSKFHRKYQNQSHFPPKTDAFVHSWPFPAIWAIGAISVAKSTQKWCLGGFMKWEHQDACSFPQIFNVCPQNDKFDNISTLANCWRHVGIMHYKMQRTEGRIWLPSAKVLMIIFWGPIFQHKSNKEKRTYDYETPLQQRDKGATADPRVEWSHQIKYFYVISQVLAS